MIVCAGTAPGRIAIARQIAETGLEAMNGSGARDFGLGVNTGGLDINDDAPTTEVARADAKLEKLQQRSRRPRKEQTSFQKQKPAL